MKAQLPDIARSACPDGSAAARCVLGIDVGGTHTKAGVFTFGGELVGTHAFDSQRVLAGGSQGRFEREIAAALGKAGRQAGCVAAVGLAVPGAVPAEGPLELCPNIDFDLPSCKELLRTLFPKAPIAVLNDADAAVLGDRWRGTSGECGAANVAFVALGTGVGAGFVFRGSLYAGAHGAAGEFGHLCVDPEEKEPCSCGKAGCLEQYASAKGLVRTARRELVARAPQPAAVETAARTAVEAFPHARAVLEAAERRDPAACAALARFSSALGFGFAQMACLVDPDVFVLGGGLSERADLFLDDVRARYRACALSVCRDTPIVVSKLGNGCGVHGAAFRALDALAHAECCPAEPAAAAAAPGTAAAAADAAVAVPDTVAVAPAAATAAAPMPR